MSAIVAQGDNLELDLVVGASKQVWPDGASVIHPYPVGLGAEELLLAWLTGNYVQTGAMLWRTAFLRMLGGWNERVLKSQDIELVLRALLRRAKAQSVEAGYGVWFHHDHSDRVSSRAGQAYLRSEVEFHDELLTLFPHDRQDLLQAMARRYYSLAAQAFRSGYNELGKSALARSRGLQFSGHLGSPLRRVVMTACGLENYSRIRHMIFRYIHRLKAHR